MTDAATHPDEQHVRLEQVESRLPDLRNGPARRVRSATARRAVEPRRLDSRMAHRAPRPVGPATDPATASIPVLREGLISRPALLAAMNATDADVLVLSAPPGYGKTTTLAQWAHAQPRPVAWLSLDAWDDDPAALLADVTSVLGRVGALNWAAEQEVRASALGPAAWRARRLMRLIDQAGRPFALVIDGAHVLRDPCAMDVLAGLMMHVPRECVVAVAAREVPAVPLARLRAAGSLVEIGPSELAMTDDEAARLVSGAGAGLRPWEVTELNARLEGWPAGLFLAAVSLRDKGGDPGGRDTGTDRFLGPDRMLVDYIREEVLARLPSEQASFLYRSAVLDALNPALCDAVLGRSDSARVLDDLERSIRFLVPLDSRRAWYRYHRLFRETLLAELRHREPHRLPELHRRAGSWLVRHDRAAQAIGHFHAAGEPFEAARQVCELAGQYAMSGRLATVRRWLAEFDDAVVEADPTLAATTVVVCAMAGDSNALRWLRRLDAAEGAEQAAGVGTSTHALACFAKALLAPGGAAAMAADAKECVQRSRPAGPWYTAMVTVWSVSRLLLGRVEEAATGLARAVDEARPGQPTALSMAHAQRGFIAVEAGEWCKAADHVRRARECSQDAGVDEDGNKILVAAIAALIATHEGDFDRARAELTNAHRLRSLATDTLPWLGVQARIVLARAHLATSDVAGARAVLADVREVQRRRPDLGVLDAKVAAIESQLRARCGTPGSTSLTPAELRLLTHLQTHLTFREIADLLFVSQNTVKTQAMSIYRKLGASRRSDAVAKAREFGLLSDGTQRIS